MKTILPAVLFAAFATTSAWAAESVQPLEKIAPYPQAEKGMKRQVIQLTPQEDESTLKVELLIGQTLEVDCNLHRLGGKLESKTLEAIELLVRVLIPLIALPLSSPKSEPQSKLVKPM